ncbi:formin-like protein 3, partial [Biomphalaria pfeifferi]
PPPTRAKSVTDLRNYSFGAGLSNIGTETVPNTPGASRRPKSLHESTIASAWTNAFF